MSNVRLIAMISIVWVHTVLFLGEAKTSASYMQVLLLQGMKFGTINFFLISGFLLGDGMTRTNRLQYFYRRAKAVLVPWAYWGCIWFAIAMVEYSLKGRGSMLNASLRGMAQEYFRFVFTVSIYWYVPNFLICLAIVLSLYKRVPDYIQGPALLLCSLFYGLNCYIRVVPERHSSAFFGFVFYLWLGSFSYRHAYGLNRWLNRISWTRLAGCVVAAVMLALVEFHILRGRGSADPLNSLRVSNQAFSVLVALAIVKCKRSLLPSWINVKRETFGIFLIHPILIELYQVCRTHISESLLDRARASAVLTIGLGVAFFLVIYITSLLHTKQIRRN